jgi:formylglycine-generating enzyme required for sulfatase activity
MPLAIKVAIAAAAALTAVLLGSPEHEPAGLDGFVDIPAREFHYRLAGDFSLDGKPATAPRVEKRLAANLRIMTRQVTGGEYARCADEGACPRPARAAAMEDRPIVGVSWRDATAYAEWISRKTGLPHRLPTDEEWTFAAGDRARDDTPPLIDPADPAQAWIARYEAEANRAPADQAAPQPAGAFGANEYGLLDVAGNVWEWTNSCFIRATLGSASRYQVTNTNCGVRVVQGAHRTYMTDFIRDPRTGGCAAGVPPSNLGFRLVVNDGGNLPTVWSRSMRIAHGA